MLSDRSADVVVGSKQLLKALENDLITKVYIANDAEHYVVKKVIEKANSRNVQIIQIDTMKELGQACKIDVSASAAGLLKQ